jgi:hypothetical protein
MGFRWWETIETERGTTMNEQLRAKEECIELSDDELINVSGGRGSSTGDVTSDNPEVCALDTCCRYAGTGDGLCQTCNYVEKKRKNKASAYQFFCTAGVQLHNLAKP